MARQNHVKNMAHQIEKEAADLEGKYSVEQVMRKIKKTYEYDGEKYIIRVPEVARISWRKADTWITASSAVPGILSGLPREKAISCSCAKRRSQYTVVYAGG